jgi:hypothetical protein
VATAQRYYLMANRLWERGDTSLGTFRDRARRGGQRTAEPVRR